MEVLAHMYATALLLLSMEIAPLIKSLIGNLIGHLVYSPGLDFTSDLLLEDSSYILFEDGTKIELET